MKVETGKEVSSNIEVDELKNKSPWVKEGFTDEEFQEVVDLFRLLLEWDRKLNQTKKEA